MHDYVDFAVETAKHAASVLMEHYKTTDPITRGTPKEIKTLFDTIADDVIKEAIEQKYPDHSYLTEETGLIDKQSDFLWIIDPLDGTGNFVNSNPFFAISIALWINGEPAVGVIEAPALEERYVGVKGEGAYMVNLESGAKIPAQLSETTDVSKAYVVYCEGGCTQKEKVTHFIDELFPSTKDMRKLGSAALESAWVGVGRADAYITPEISIWDIAAGIVFIREAGGEILDFEGKPWSFPEMEKTEHINMLATNGKLEITTVAY